MGARCYRRIPLTPKPKTKHFIAFVGDPFLATTHRLYLRDGGTREYPSPSSKPQFSLLFLTHRSLRARSTRKGTHSLALEGRPPLFGERAGVRVAYGTSLRVPPTQDGAMTQGTPPAPCSDLPFFLDAPFLATTPHGCDPLDAPDGLGLQSRTVPIRISPWSSTNQLPTLSFCLGIPEKGSTSVARAFGSARPPLRVPTA